MNQLENSLELNIIIEQIAGLCSFSLGQDAVRALEPSYDPLVIRNENARIREALAAVIHDGPMPFHGIRDLSGMLKNAVKGRLLTGMDLAQEISFIQGIHAIKSYEQGLETPHEAIHDLVSTMTEHRAAEKMLSSCVNEYGEILDTASPGLREVRRQLRNIDGEISAAVQRFLSAHSSSVVDSIVTYRNGRAVLLIKASEKNSFGGLLYGDSASGQASYVEPAALVGVNNRKQELAAREQEEIAEVLRRCSKVVQDIASEELANLETCTLLDSLFARAEWGKERDAIAAALSEEKEINLKKARHPLIDPKKVVPNTYRLKDPQRMLLITGPNTGGKTVSMKIIGLFVLMTYCGIPVPAEDAKVPFFDHVYADIGDDQSVVSSLSSFSAHVEKQADILRNATSESLVLLDEIGSGTDPKEGEALAISILNELRSRRTMTVATTHYSRLKAYGKRHSDIMLASVQFDMEKLEPTYRYLEGVTGQSNALEVAKRYGLPEDVIRYARFLKDQARSEEDQLIEKLEKQLNETELKNAALDAKLEEIKAYQRTLHTEKVNFEKERDEWHAKAEAEADAYVEEARKKADEVLRNMRRMQQNARYHEVLAERQKLNRAETEEEPAEKPAVKQGGYRPGDVVELRAGGQPAKVLSVRKKQIVISLNGREMQVKESQIRPSLKIIADVKEKPVMTVSGGDLFSSMPIQCNLIGMHVDEAMEAMNSYLDQAKIHGLKQFRIVHGDGSGALRKAVHDALAKNPDVKEYRLGMPQEGGTGATVVTMKD